MEKYENLSICAKCGGMCCKKCGCDYFVSDFESINIENLEKALATGYVSIVASLDIKIDSKDRALVTPILSLRARNINRDVIDLLSMKTTCSALESNGCRYTFENRPSGGATLIPGENMTCHTDIDRYVELQKWIPYQKVLQRLVKRHTGMSADAKFREDVKKLFEDILNENYEGISKVEIKEIAELIPHLVKAYPEEYQSAMKKHKNPLLLKRNYKIIN